MSRLTYWNDKEKGSALPVATNDLGDTVDLETICAKLAKLEDAEDEARLFITPDMPQDISSILEPLKIQSALNSELLKLQLRKEHNPDKVSILDYTIIAVLQDALKMETAKRDRCCMCPGAICPGIPGTPHPEASPCRLTGGDTE